MSWREIKPGEGTGNVFNTVGKDWLLVGAGDENGHNAMTASWGLMGVLWGEPVAEVFIRPSRYTKKFVDENDWFSIQVLPEALHGAHKVFGTMSGRDVDKVKESGLTPVFTEKAPYYAEARTVLILRKLYAEPFKEEAFLVPETRERNYPERDYHTAYVGKIEKILIRD